jgi:sirohydrochlorin cobaltochelatase
VSVTGLILFAHGARDPRWAEPFERLKRKVEAARPGLPVALAYLEIMQPDLPAAADALIAAGCRSLRIVPVFLGQGGHVREDLPAVVATVAARHPAIAVALATAIGEHDAVLDRIADVAIEGLPG